MRLLLLKNKTIRNAAADAERWWQCHSDSALTAVEITSRKPVHPAAVKWRKILPSALIAELI
jgi:hypothetical protein